MKQEYKPKILQEAAYGHAIEVTFTKVAGVKVSDKVPNSVMCQITYGLEQMKLSGQFDIVLYTANGPSPCYSGAWRVVPTLDHDFMARIALWVNNYGENEGLTRELFHETYGTNMGDHYAIKWESVYQHNIMKMIGYFGLGDKDGQKFCDMIMKQMAKYEKRIGHKRKG